MGRLKHGDPVIYGGGKEAIFLRTFKGYFSDFMHASMVDRDGCEIHYPLKEVFHAGHDSATHKKIRKLHNKNCLHDVKHWEKKLKDAQHQMKWCKEDMV